MHSLDSSLVSTDPKEGRIDFSLLVIDKEIKKSMLHRKVLPERHRTMLLDNDVRVTANCLEPLAELLGIAYGGTESSNGDGLWKVKDHLFPDSPTIPISKVMNLVHDDVQ